MSDSIAWPGEKFGFRAENGFAKGYFFSDIPADQRPSVADVVLVGPAHYEVTSIQPSSAAPGLMEVRAERIPG